MAKFAKVAKMQFGYTNFLNKPFLGVAKPKQ